MRYMNVIKSFCTILVTSIFTLLTIFSLPSCGRNKHWRDTGRDHLPALRIGAMSSMDYLPYIVAKKLGIYDSLGLDLEIVKFFSANDRDAAFRAGQVDGTVIDYTGAAIQHAAGVPLGLVVKHDGYFEMMAQSECKEMQDLVGKQVAVSRNTVIDYATDMMLRAAQMTEDDVQKPEINKIPLRMEMMLSGQVDASVFPDPFITISKSQGFISLSSTRDLGICVTGTIMSGDALANKRSSILVLLEGYNLAVDYILSHPLSDWQEILVEDAGVPKGLVRLVRLPHYTHTMLPSESDLQQTIAWLHDHKLIPEGYSGEGLVVSLD